MFIKKTPKKEPPRRRARLQQEGEGSKFRRGRSLGGSLSDDVASGTQSHNQLQSDRVLAQSKKRKRHRLVRRLLSVSLILGVMVIAYAHHIHSFAVSFNGQLATYPDTEPYKTSAMKFASSGLASQFGPTLSKPKLEAYLMQQHTEIAAATIATDLFSKTPRLRVTLRKPVLIWQTAKDPTPFYVDASGTSFSINAYGNDKKLVRINDESGVPATLGVPVASSRQISFLGQFVGQVASYSDKKLEVEKIVFPPDSTKQVYVYLKGRPYFIKTYLERSAKAQAKELVKGVTYLEQNGKAPAEYMDVRVPEKIFYK